MQVLLRGKVAGFSSWGVELLVNQLYDQSVQVAHSALHVLEEACDVEVGMYDQSVQVAHSVLHVLEEACDVEVGI